MKYTKDQLLGHGTYGDVYLYKDEFGNNYAGKKIFDTNNNEFNVCQNINSLKIQQLAKFIKKENNLIYYEYIKGKTLNSLKLDMKEKEYINIIKELVNTLKKLEEKEYYYLDISNNNIIIQENKEIKLIDYTFLSKKSNTPEIVGSYTNVPPEYFLENNIIHNKFDVFTIGVLLFEYYFYRKPIIFAKEYKDNCFYFCYNNKKQNCRNQCLKKHCENQKINNNIIYIITKCLEFDYNNRFTIQELNYNLNQI